MKTKRQVKRHLVFPGINTLAVGANRELQKIVVSEPVWEYVPVIREHLDRMFKTYGQSLSEELFQVHLKAYDDMADEEIVHRINGAIKQHTGPNPPTPGEIRAIGLPQPAKGGLRNDRRRVIDPLLREKGWSMNDLAREAGLDHHTIAGFMNGRKTYPNTRKKLADALKIKPSHLPK